jgi:uncharacterized membrane protein
LARAFENSGPIQAPWQVKVAVNIPGIQRVLGYAVGIGVRPEHVREETPAGPRRFRAAKTVFAALGIAAAAAALTWVAWKALNRASEEAE